MGKLTTTIGRIIFNEILAPGMPYYNCSLAKKGCARVIDDTYETKGRPARSEEHTSELQSLMRISYAVFCLKKKNNDYKRSANIHTTTHIQTILALSKGTT